MTQRPPLTNGLMKCYNSLMSYNAAYFSEKWRNDPRRREVNRVSKEKARFGFDTAKLRENGVCADCGLTNAQHKEKYNKALSVDHINNVGRNSKLPDNKLKNLQLLCLPCHTKKTNIVDTAYKYKDPERGKKVWSARHARYPQLRIDGYTVVEYAKIKGYSSGRVYQLIKDGKINAKKST